MAVKQYVEKHVLIPKHSKVSDAEAKRILKNLKITFKELPKILSTDPAIAKLGINSGDIIKIERNSPTAGKSTFYRGVVNV